MIYKSLVSLLVITSLAAVSDPYPIGGSNPTNPSMEQLKYDIVDYQSEPTLEINMNSGCNCLVSLRFTIDTYEQGYYLFSQSFLRNVVGVETLSFPLFHFQHNNQYYDLVVRLWVGNSAIQNLVFPIHSALQQNLMVTTENSRIQEVTSLLMSSTGIKTSLYQTSEFKELFVQTNELIPTINVERLYFEYLNTQALSLQQSELAIETGFEGSGIEYSDGRFRFPLSIEYDNGFYRFSLMGQYYFNRKRGVMTSVVDNDTVATDKLIISLTNDSLTSVYGQIILEGVGVNQSTYTIDMQFNFSKQVFGSCENALVCIRRQSPLPSLNYNSSIIIR